MIQQVGEKIRFLRSAKGFTQANMAEELGMTTSAYSKIERVEINIPLNRLYQIAEVLDVPIITFFQEERLLQFKSPQREKYGYALASDIEDLRETLKSLQSELTFIKENIQNLQPKDKIKQASKYKRK